MNRQSLPTTVELFRSLAWSVYLPSFLMSVCQSSVLLIIPLFALDLGESVGAAAVVFGLRGLGNMAADVPAGWGVSKLGDKRMMLTGIGLMGAAGLFASTSDSAWQLAIAALLFGSAMATWLVARLTHISESIQDAHRGRAIATLAGVQRMGGLAGPVLAGLVAHQFGFIAVFVLVFLFATTAFVLIFLMVPGHRPVQRENEPSLLGIVPDMLRTHGRTFRTAGVAMLLLTVLRAARQLLIPLWGASLALGVDDIGLIVGFAAAVDLMMFPVAGHVMDHFGRRYAAISCIGLLSLGLILVPWSTGFLELGVCAAIAGIGNGLGSGINATLGSDFAPPDRRGQFLGVWRLMGDSGSLLGPLFIGQVASLTSLAAVFSILSFSGLAAILIVVFAVEETLSHASSDQS